MTAEPRLIVQVPTGGAVDRQLSAQPPESIVSGEVVVERGAADAYGHLDVPDVGKVVMSVPSPEALAREPAEVVRVIRHAGAGVEPLVIDVQAAEELRADELAAVLEAAGHSERAVILRILGEA